MSYTPTEWESTDVVTATRMNALEQAVGEMNMSYTPNTWSDGDILSAEKMNALEQAVASGGGGGGSSDFSTANVTITNNSDANWQTQFASLENIGVGEHPDVIVCNTQGISAKTVNDFKIIMYKNYTGLRSQSTTTVEVSGNAELIGRVIAITGDCTITIS